MFDEARSLHLTLPLAASDLTRWEALRPNSLAVWIPKDAPPDLSWIADLPRLRHVAISGVYRGRVRLAHRTTGRVNLYRSA